jgi:hypothetical protein
MQIRINKAKILGFHLEWSRIFKSILCDLVISEELNVPLTEQTTIYSQPCFLKALN